MRRALIVAIALLAGGPAAGEDARDYDGIAKATTCRAWTQMRGEVRDGARTKLQAWLTRTVIGDWNAPRMPGSDAGLSRHLRHGRCVLRHLPQKNPQGRRPDADRGYGFLVKTCPAARQRFPGT